MRAEQLGAICGLDALPPASGLRARGICDVAKEIMEDVRGLLRSSRRICSISPGEPGDLPGLPNENLDAGTQICRGCANGKRLASTWNLRRRQIHAAGHEGLAEI